jgi:hypothetical protein
VQFKTRDDGTLEFSASPRELERFADMVRDAAVYGENQIGTLISDGGVTRIVSVAHEEYEVA